MNIDGWILFPSFLFTLLGMAIFILLEPMAGVCINANHLLLRMPNIDDLFFFTMKIPIKKL